MSNMLPACRRVTGPRARQTVALARYASTSTKEKFRVLVVGAGSGGLTVANQIYNRFKAAGKPLNAGDVVVLDAADYHYYQVSTQNQTVTYSTLVGAGLGSKTDFRRPLASLFPPHITHIAENVKSFYPESSSVTTTSAGLKINWDGIAGLPQALADPSSGVSSIYSYDTCSKVQHDIDALQSGNAIFTQPAGIIKCPGAPQKIMWMAWDKYQKSGRGNNIKIDFMTGMPFMFSVKKYSDVLNALRIERGIGAEFQHNLVSIDVANRKATFKKVDGSIMDRDFTLMHVVPPMGPLDFIKGSPIADPAGWVEVDQATLRHVKPEFGNIFALGDCSSLPTAKTIAAITSQAPVLTENLFSVMDTGKVSSAKYDGYTSCPLLTGYGELMLTEFKYGFVPKESFANYLGDQTKRRRLFYHFKKDLFPWVDGKWFGPSGLFRPKFV
ncbi:sulfide-quinone oxidoreductase [Suillus variegatus]|nr:sulfide-quinone oxidoreductase [Suillus variegatus]